MKSIRHFLESQSNNIEINDIKEYVDFIYNYGFDNYYDKIKNNNGDLKSAFRKIVDYHQYNGSLFFNLGLLDYIVWASNNNSTNINDVYNKIIKNFNSYDGMSKDDLIKVLNNVCKYLDK